MVTRPTTWEEWAATLPVGHGQELNNTPTGVPGEQVCDSRRHPRFPLASRFQCPECGGDDPYGRGWCPICDFCCGC